MSTINNFLTVTDIAEEMRLTTARIRQICIANKIGTKKGHMRFLSPSDVQKIKRIHRDTGYNKN